MLIPIFVLSAPLCASGILSPRWREYSWLRLMGLALAGLILGIFSQTLDTLFQPHFFSSMDLGHILLFYARQPDWVYGILIVLVAAFRKVGRAAPASTLFLLCGFYFGRACWDVLVGDWMESLQILPQATMVRLLTLLLLGLMVDGQRKQPWWWMLGVLLLPLVSALAVFSGTFLWLDSTVFAVASVLLVTLLLRRTQHV